MFFSPAVRNKFYQITFRQNCGILAFTAWTLCQDGETYFLFIVIFPNFLAFLNVTKEGFIISKATRPISRQLLYCLDTQKILFFIIILQVQRIISNSSFPSLSKPENY